jgi:DNA-binding CsgD family transcriptional regulator
VERKHAVDERAHAITKETGFDQRMLARVAGNIAELPAVATQDWVQQTAETLAGIDPWCRVGVMITHAEANGQIHSNEATGCRISKLEDERSGDAANDASGIRTRLERLNDLGFHLPAAGLHNGLAANADDLGAWRDGPLGRVWNVAGVEKLFVGLVPIGEGVGDRVLLVFLALAAGPAPTARAGVRTLGALLPLLARRARKSLPPVGPIAWMTDREQDVLDRLILGRSVREIAEELGRSPHTVHDHVKSLHRKLNASSRGELVARALGHIDDGRPDIEPMLLEKMRAATQIEPMPASAMHASAARRIP